MPRQIGKGKSLMLLHNLISQFDPKAVLSGVPNVEITGVCEDSRQVQPGNLFIARHGQKADGAQFVADAASRGAVAVLTPAKLPQGPLPQILTSQTTTAASILGNLFHSRPSGKIRVVGVTGTNGKTTTTYLIRHILSSVKTRCGLIGTVELDDGRHRREASMTTPAATEIASLLATMRDKGCRACVMEVSSHALDQERVAGVEFAGAAFTNLTGDHLDYHDTMENYAAAKSKLFTSLSETAVAVVNADDKWSARIIQKCQGRIIRFGFGKDADYRARDVAITSAGSNFILHSPDGRAEVKMQLIGRHNIENALAAAALVGEVFGLSAHQIASGLRDAVGAPGRLQAVRLGQPFAVLVDYAHTDDALENVLSALRPLTRGKLRVLFGCGGDRDRKKRPRMARTAEKLADAVYITSDNPRTEEPEAIIEQIIGGLSDSGRADAVVEADRHAAIQRILEEAQSGDVVLIAGKGHENYQIIGTEKRHFDDVEEASSVLRARFAEV